MSPWLNWLDHWAQTTCAGSIPVGAWFYRYPHTPPPPPLSFSHHLSVPTFHMTNCTYVTRLNKQYNNNLAKWTSQSGVWLCYLYCICVLCKSCFACERKWKRLWNALFSFFAYGIQFWELCHIPKCAKTVKLTVNVRTLLVLCFASHTLACEREGEKLWKFVLVRAYACSLLVLHIEFNMFCVWNSTLEPRVRRKLMLAENVALLSSFLVVLQIERFIPTPLPSTSLFPKAILVSFLARLGEVPPGKKFNLCFKHWQYEIHQSTLHNSRFVG